MFRFNLALFAIALPIVAAPPALQFSTHFIDPGNGAQNKLIAADGAGNFFVVSTISSGTNKSTVHVTKTDSAGNALAAFDFGGSGLTTPAAATVDGSGNLLIGGNSIPTDFPLVSPLQATGFAFLTKLDAGLTKILYSTRLGTSDSDDSVTGIALDIAGNIYVTGNAGAGLPVTSGVFQPQPPATFFPLDRGFVAEISPEGSRLIFSTYYTGTSTYSLSQCLGIGIPTCPAPIATLPRAIAVDADGSVIIAGTTSDTIPVTPGAFETLCTCAGSLFGGFVAKLSPGGTALEWGTYISLAHTADYSSLNEGPASGLSVQSIALDHSGNVVLGGYTPSGFPVTAGALQSSFVAVRQETPPAVISPLAGFVAVLDASGSKLLDATYFGGGVISGESNVPYSGVAGVAVAADGTIWLTGGSAATLLPASSSPVLGQNYVAALSPDLSTVAALNSVPDGGAGTAIALGQEGVVAAVGSGALLTGQPGNGPSIMGVAPSVAYSVSDVTAPYQLITIYGVNIGPAEGLGAQVSAGKIARSLGGFQVLFGDSPAALLYAGPNQINAIVPAGVGTSGTAAIRIVTPSGTLDGPVLGVQQVAPQVITDVSGFATPTVNQDGTINSAANPATSGSIVSVWLTGIGSPNGFDDAFNFTEFSPLAVSVLGPSGGPGQASFDVLYAGSAPTQPSGISQVNFVLPPQKYNGETWVTFQIKANGVNSGGFNIYVK